MSRAATTARETAPAAVPPAAPAARAKSSVAATGTAYARAVLLDKPTAMLRGLQDVVGRRAAGAAVGRPAVVRMPNGDPARHFNGKGQYLRFADSKAFEVDATGVLTVEYWMRPDALQFSDQEGSGYVYVLGKGTPGAHEWYTRMYSQFNAERRPNRISGYSFNPSGGLGAGSYFQDRVRAGTWIHLALVINTKARSARYPMGYTRIYKNGLLRDTDSLKDYNITPRSGSGPLRIGTGYLGSFFKGAIGSVAFYPREIAAKRIRAHYVGMRLP